MSYYVEPEYWAEGYAEGDAKLVALSSVALSSTAVAMGNNAYAALAPSASSSVKAAVVRKLASTGFLSTGLYVEHGYVVGGFAEEDSAFTGASPTVLLSSRASKIVAESAGNAAFGRRLFNGAKVNALSTGFGAARIKWEIEAEPVNSWSDLAEPTHAWVNIAAGSSSWTDSLMPHERNDEGLH